MLASQKVQKVKIRESLRLIVSYISYMSYVSYRLHDKVGS